MDWQEYLIMFRERLDQDNFANNDTYDQAVNTVFEQFENFEPFYDFDTIM